MLASSYKTQLLLLWLGTRATLPSPVGWRDMEALLAITPHGCAVASGSWGVGLSLLRDLLVMSLLRHGLRILEETFVFFSFVRDYWGVLFFFWQFDSAESWAFWKALCCSPRVALSLWEGAGGLESVL
jgi:hypothetical protein